MRNRRYCVRQIASARIVVLVLASVIVASLEAAELQPRTVAAFDRYVRLTEARMSRDGAFIWVDGLPESQKRVNMAALRRGELVIERVMTRDGEEKIGVPDGLIHHWLGLVFVPGASLDQA